MPARRGLGLGLGSDGLHHMRAVVGSAAFAAFAVLALYTYGAWRLATPLPERPAVAVTVIQGNNQDGAQWRPGSYGKGIDRYLQMSAEAAARAHPSIIVWPEAAVTFFLAHEPRYQALIVPLLRNAGADLIVGAPHYEDADPALPRFLNSAFYLTSDGRIAGRYDKTHLLPFAEYFPLHSIAFLRRSFERVRTFTPGGDSMLLDTRLGKVAVVICFEAIFADQVRRQMARGADVLVNLSNDVWLGRGAGPQQHVAMITLRAVENRTWLIRATTTGVSAIIDPYGRVQAHSDMFAPATLDAQVVPLQVSTVYKQFGDLFAEVCVVLSVAALLWLRRPQPVVSAM